MQYYVRVRNIVCEGGSSIAMDGPIGDLRDALLRAPPRGSNLSVEFSQGCTSTVTGWPVASSFRIHISS